MNDVQEKDYNVTWNVLFNTLIFFAEWYWGIILPKSPTQNQFETAVLSSPAQYRQYNLYVNIIYMFNPDTKLHFWSSKLGSVLQ